MDGHDASLYAVDMGTYHICVFFVDKDMQFIDNENYISGEEVEEFMEMIKAIFSVSELSLGDEVSNRYTYNKLVEKEWNYRKGKLMLMLSFLE